MAASLPEIIHRLPLFEDCEPAVLAEVERIACTRVYRDGDVLCSQGAKADELFVILSGNVAISADEIFLVNRGANELVGEQAFIEGTDRGATAKAQGMVRALVVPRAAVERLLSDSGFTRNLLRQLSRKLNQATSDRALRYHYEHLLFGEFRSHVSAEVLQALLASGEDYGAPRVVDAVILFADIRGFTTRSAKMKPDDVAAELTAFLDHAVDTVHQHGGMVDKFIGDAMMAVWGGLVATGRDMVAQAFECARRLVETSEGFKLGDGVIQLGIGLNAGDVFMGVVGGEKKRTFTVLGAPVNLAARYQGLSETLGAAVVMGPDFVARLSDADRVGLRAHPECQIKGADNQTLHSWALNPRGDAATQTQGGGE